MKIEEVKKYTEISGKLIKAQVFYQSSAEAIASANAIVKNKLRNAEFLLTDYIHSRKRYGYEFESLLQTQKQLLTARKNISDGASIKKLFIAEAHAARVYWGSFKILCKLQSSWCRTYPHAPDPANQLLNIGYTFLGRACLGAVTKTGLMPQIGIYHGNNSGKSLAYDLMEAFRIPCVDSIVISFFSRNSKTEIKKDSQKFKKIIYALSAIYEKKFLYKNNWQTVQHILEHEAVNIKTAILNQEVYHPYQFHWGHTKRIKT